MSIRTEKISSLIKRILAQPINDLAKEFGGGMVTVTDVKVSSDLQIAKIYVSVFNSENGPGRFMDILEDKEKLLKSHIASKARLRYTPELRFYLDDTLDRMEHIQELLDSVKKERRERKNDE